MWAKSLGLSCATLLEHQGFSPPDQVAQRYLVEGKKVAGILAETVTLDHYVGVVVGIGVNVNMEKACWTPLINRRSHLPLSTSALSRGRFNRPFGEPIHCRSAILKSKGFSPFHAHYDRLLAYEDRHLPHRKHYSHRHLQRGG